MDTRPVLLTGFEPFGDHQRNPSAVVVEHFDGSLVDGRPVVGAVLPVSGAAIESALRSAIERCGPAIVLCLGLASGRTRLGVERIAINTLDFPIPDNDGVQRSDGPVIDGGPAAYFSTLPVKAIVAAWRHGGIPGYLSNTAGTYLCNQAMYLALTMTAGTGSRAGFIHLPELPEDAARSNRSVPSMALDTMVTGIRLAIEVAVQVTSDAALSTGATH